MPFDWTTVIAIAGLVVASYLAGVGTGAWVWAIVARLEEMIRGKADKADLDKLRDRIEK